MIVMLALYLMAGVAGRIGGSFSLHELSGLYAKSPLFAAIALALFFSVSGLPPFSGLLAQGDAGQGRLRFRRVVAGCCDPRLRSADHYRRDPRLRARLVADAGFGNCRTGADDGQRDHSACRPDIAVHRHRALSRTAAGACPDGGHRASRADRLSPLRVPQRGPTP